VVGQQVGYRVPDPAQCESTVPVHLLTEEKGKLCRSADHSFTNTTVRNYQVNKEPHPGSKNDIKVRRKGKVVPVL